VTAPVFFRRLGEGWRLRQKDTVRVTGEEGLSVRHAQDTIIFFSSDVHGSELCWMKFINAARVYKASVLIMGGDLTGKAVVPIVRVGATNYEMDFMGRRSHLDAEALGEAQRRVRFNGFYPYVCEPDEMLELANSNHLDQVFRKLIQEQIARWMEIATERLAPAGVACYVMPGNDDEMFVDEILDRMDYITNPDMRVVPVGSYQMLSCSWVPPTPWDSPRECSEPVLADKLNELATMLDPAVPTIMNLHTPPSRTGLDDAPELRQDLTIVRSAGQAKMIPVGSHAVRELIERIQPMVSLHGHIHESRGVVKIGNTVCINPGSSYGEGTLDGCIVTVRDNKVRNTQLVRG
jgi:uncharacterized protein